VQQGKIGVLIYREPFTDAQCIGFGLVWTALILFEVESFLRHWAPPDPVVLE
jgi:EamA domain-containing membrane protein RarD